MSNLLTSALILTYLGYGMWLARTYYDLWQYRPIMNQHSLAFLLLLGLSLAWPIVVPISYIELLREQTRANRALFRSEGSAFGDQSLSRASTNS
ncbi:MAG: hypothetical protein AB4042_20900 [Leptolyngbyaceae cyanobacterium]